MIVGFINKIVLQISPVLERKRRDTLKREIGGGSERIHPEFKQFF